MRSIVLASRPDGAVKETDFALVECETPVAGDGELLVETLFLSLDPGMRNLLGADDGYIAPIAVGAPLTTTIVGRVLVSNHDGFEPGNFVVGTGSASERAIVTPGPMTWRVEPSTLTALSNALGVQGAIGLTAYFGMIAVGRPVAGETVLVSGASGAVGSIAGQIAKIRGCKVIGLAGGAVKTRRLTDEFQFDVGIDHSGLSSDELRQAIATACPNGVDLYFDNVGGMQLDAALATMSVEGRIVACGQISSYDGHEPPAMRNLFQIVAKRLRIEGFLVFTFADQFPNAIAELGHWVAHKQLVAREEIVQGLAHTPSAFLRLFAGTNHGKVIVQL